NPEAMVVDIRQKTTTGVVFCVGYVVTGHGCLASNLTYSGHGPASYHFVRMRRPPDGDTRNLEFKTSSPRRHLPAARSRALYQSQQAKTSGELLFCGWHCPPSSPEQSVLGKRHGVRITDNEMVQQAYIHQLQGHCQPLRETDVCLTGLCHTRWMVVGHNDSSGILRQRLFDDFTRIDAGTINGAVEMLFVSK